LLALHNPDEIKAEKFGLKSGIRFTRYHPDIGSWRNVDGGAILTDLERSMKKYSTTSPSLRANALTMPRFGYAQTAATETPAANRRSGNDCAYGHQTAEAARPRPKKRTPPPAAAQMCANRSLSLWKNSDGEADLGKQPYTKEVIVRGNMRCNQVPKTRSTPAKNVPA